MYICTVNKKTSVMKAYIRNKIAWVLQIAIYTIFVVAFILAIIQIFVL